MLVGYSDGIRSAAVIMIVINAGLHVTGDVSHTVAVFSLICHRRIHPFQICFSVKQENEKGKVLLFYSGLKEISFKNRIPRILSVIPSVERGRGMSLYAIGDLHLSLGVDKPMDIFAGWENYVEKLTENWTAKIKPEDTVVIAGDISWGMTLQEAKEDFTFLHNLPGQKILLKGNHDYWFSTKRKVEDFFELNGWQTLHLLFNNSYEYDGFSICGTRGWINEPGEPANQKVLSREAGRMELSLQSANCQPLVFFHYPPIFIENQCVEMLEVLKKYQVKRVFYGHLHGKSCSYAVQGVRDGIDYRLISGDYIQFNPVRIM